MTLPIDTYVFRTNLDDDRDYRIAGFYDDGDCRLDSGTGEISAPSDEVYPVSVDDLPVELLRSEYTRLKRVIERVKRQCPNLRDFRDPEDYARARRLYGALLDRLFTLRRACVQAFKAAA